eukprot:749821-Hanusia_phi.AAC.2
MWISAVRWKDRKKYRHPDKRRKFHCFLDLMPAVENASLSTIMSFLLQTTSASTRPKTSRTSSTQSAPSR